MAEEKTQNQDPNLRKPPNAGGPRRIQPGGRQPRLNGEFSAEGRRQRETQASQTRPKKKSLFRKSLPYLVPAAATGGSIGFILNVM